MIGFDVKIADHLMLNGLNRCDIKRVGSDPYLSSIDCPKRQTFVSYLHNIIANEDNSKTNETLTESLTLYYLYEHNFHSFPLQLFPKQKLMLTRFKVVPDYVVTKYGYIVMTVETKDKNTSTHDTGDNQIACQILASAVRNNALSIVRSEDYLKYNTIYGLKVLGTKLTLFKATVNQDFMTLVLSGSVPTNTLNVIKYVSDYDHYHGLDLTDPNQRNIILEFTQRLIKQL